MRARLNGQEIGARIGHYLMDNDDELYPTDGSDARKRQNIPFTEQQITDLELIAFIWNELDVALKRGRSKKWKLTSVVTRMVAVGLASFWKQIGGRPGEDEDQAAVAKRAIQKIAKNSRK